MSNAANPVITPAALLKHWQEHRSLSRRMIEAFPDDKLYSYAIGGMRPYSELAMEMVGMAVPTLTGIATGTWKVAFEAAPKEKAALLAVWDEQTEKINALWPKVRPEAWQEVMDCFGYFQGPAINILLYVIDNEIHHRAQGYVYLRSLGIEPPAFYARDLK